MANYYMLGGDGKEYGPVTAEQLRQWVAEGRANAQTQVRSEVGGSYLPLGSVPELNAAAGGYTAAPASLPLAQALAQASGSASSDAAAQNKRLAMILAGGAGWMKFMAVLMFIYAGVATLFTFGLGLVFAWMPVWLGITLWSAGGKAQQAVFTGAEADLAQALDKVRFFFKLQGILLIVGVAGGIIVVILGAFSAMAGLGNIH